MRLSPDWTPDASKRRGCRKIRASLCLPSLGRPRRSEFLRAHSAVIISPEEFLQAFVGKWSRQCFEVNDLLAHLHLVEISNYVCRWVSSLLKISSIV